jgi:hypothetical protein
MVASARAYISAINKMITWNKRRTKLAGEAAEAAQTTQTKPSKPIEDSVNIPGDILNRDA